MRLFKSWRGNGRVGAVVGGGGESQGCVGTMIPLGARVIIPGQCENITLSQKKRGEEGEEEEEGEKIEQYQK